MSNTNASDPLTCWVISDGRRGIENQALGLAEALARLIPLKIERYTLTHSGIFHALPPLFQITLKSTPHAYGLPKTRPTYVIGCGRHAIAPMIALKKHFNHTIFTIYIQDPRISPKYFDRVIAPNHDALSGSNVDTIIGSPNRVTQDMFSEANTAFKSHLDCLPTQRVAVLIGGESKAYSLNTAIAKHHIATLQTLLHKGYGIMISLSRRTPEAISDLYKEALKEQPQIWLYDGIGNNPYFAFLSTAQAILVTEESTNMLTEACGTGKPVFTLPMHKKSTSKARKFEYLKHQLTERCALKPFETIAEFESILQKPTRYEPLNETARIAKHLLRFLPELELS